MDLTKGTHIFPWVCLNCISIAAELFHEICWTGLELKRALRETPAAAGAGSVWAAAAANIYSESEESLNDDELQKNIKASEITRLLSWGRDRSPKDGATGFP